MFTLGALTLPSGAVWSNRWEEAPVEQTVLETLGAKPVIFHAQKIAGRPVTIRSLEDQGWITLAQAETLLEMASAAGAIYVFNADGVLYNVIFQHNNPPALSVHPLIERREPKSGDYFTFELKLLTV